MEQIVLTSDRFSGVGAFARLPDCVQFEFGTTAPPTAEGLGAGRMRIQLPGLIMQAAVGLDPAGDCNEISSYLPLWVRFGVVAEVEFNTAGEGGVGVDALEITELYVSSDDWQNLALVLYAVDAVPFEALIYADLGPLDHGMDSLTEELVTALMDSVPLALAMPTVPLGNEVAGALQDVVAGATEFRLDLVSLMNADGARVDPTQALRSRIALNLALSLRTDELP